MSNPFYIQLEPGTRINHFVLEERIAEAQSGEVWRARDATQQVAIKFMNFDLLTGGEAEKHRLRFKREVYALERLVELPNVPTLLGYNLNFQRPYLVMEYVSTPAWSDLLATGEMMRVPVRQRVELLDAVAGTIAQIHKNGLIHRAVVPANIHGTDVPYLLDYSSAIHAEHALKAQADMGDVLYNPPFDGQALSQRTDDFAFSLIAYEMLFGTHPVVGATEVTEDRAAMRGLMLERLQAGTWRVPLRLAANQVPGSLKGADLEKLDTLFTLALKAQQFRPNEVVQRIKDAVLIPSNSPYLDYTPPVGAKPVPVTSPNPNGAGTASPQAAAVPPRQPVDDGSPATERIPPARAVAEPSAARQRLMRIGVVAVIVAWVVVMALLYVYVLN